MQLLLLQDYALRRLEAAHESERVLGVLATWLVALFKQHSTDSPATAPHVVGELDNLRVATSWAMEQQNGNLLAGLATVPRNWLYVVFGAYAEWQTRLETALAIGVSEGKLRADVLQSLGDLELYLRNLEAARAQ